MSEQEARAALHQHLIRNGTLPPDLGRFYDKAFSQRQEADYNALATFDPQTVAQHITDAERFVSAMDSLLGRTQSPNR
jgi:uncharacterized protein (UPF0332 family)